MDKNFLEGFDLGDMLKEMEESQDEEQLSEEEKAEMDASQRRYQEIIKKHKNEQ